MTEPETRPGDGAAECTPHPLSRTELRLSPAPETVFWSGAVAETGALARAAADGATAVLVTDAALARTPVIAAVRDAVEAAGTATVLFDGVVANPTTEAVDAGVRAVADSGAGAIVAVGGGSSMDAAKAIALGAAAGVPAARLGEPGFASARGLPIVAVPTTAGTGSEVNGFGVVTDSASRRKVYIGNASTVARAAVLDPDLTLGLPASPTAATGMDALTHAIESFCSVRANPYSDGIALEAVRTVGTHLERAVADGADLEARSAMLLAAHVAGIGFASTGLGLVHGIAHPLGARYGIAHGLALSVVLGDVLRFNLRARTARTARIAFALGVGRTDRGDDRNAGAAIERVEELAARVGMAARLRDLGVPEDGIDALAADTLADPVTANTPVAPSHSDVTGLLERAW
ncbi:alcohol dehydrogenase [Murinocardiopsis flavida]|uniref:Alcohol dehydrogenase n=1 Tax=Murinocardiopsis flavida TaxID=645275 RepID=A0A2P8CYZ9_9ACTN|nr:iron-containing alcohol dehydrogenase [Murinocardiopsis flavida]PSK90205.1 alcohol dehydrogenase [Murinocardiopsis flavida]